ncbi:DUF805 domain-containing protein [Cohaesibacter celericrescens]|uniref:DUF805 domain-containing protein n=1 Tax=Cohaesibacter celericrescens TaxID=2067669 RepID=A0A2N5XVA6_9HYPH|nr:DUF805 domain-containing protein [Cohaesibacter celericrescens]PLW78410.1 hypothetical protein C0081_04775 [Cohaesibacter celericrescens]
MFSLYGKIFSILRASFAFSGRTARKEFWFFFVFYALMYFAALGADVTYFRQAEPTGFLLILQGLFGGREPFVWIHFLLLTPAMASITVRRLHDRGHTGWWGLVYLIPLLGLVPLVAMLGRASQPGFNRFGANPFALANVAKNDAVSSEPAPAEAPSQMAPAE